MKVEFEILGHPQGKGRPKFSTHGGFAKARTPEKTVLYENLVKTEYRIQCGKTRFGDSDALRMKISAYYEIPASASKKKKGEMASNAIRPTKKPDLDNVFKVIADSLNQIAYRDDAQIVDATVNKYFSDVPRVVVVIENGTED